MADNSGKRRADTLESGVADKRAKPDIEEEGEGGWSETDCILSGFKTRNILKYSAREKNICLDGHIDGQDAVVILEKTPISRDRLDEFFTASKMKLEMQNDIYWTYQLQTPPHLNEVKSTLVWPATETHVKKYRLQESFLVEETKEDYNSITLPYILKKTNLQWVYNILEKKAETDRIVYEDPDPKLGFVLLPDMKWDQKQTDDLYLIAIVRQRNIKSLRDLTSEHLPLLMNIFQKGQQAILNRYNLTGNKLRVYLHYQPTYYHLHVHFTKLGYDAPGCGVERAHLLADVIQNLDADPHYYKTWTMYFPLREDDELLKKFKAAGRL